MPHIHRQTSSTAGATICAIVRATNLRTTSPQNPDAASWFLQCEPTHSQQRVNVCPGQILGCSKEGCVVRFQQDPQNDQRSFLKGQLPAPRLALHKFRAIHSGWTSIAFMMSPGIGSRRTGCRLGSLTELCVGGLTTLPSAPRTWRRLSCPCGPLTTSKRFNSSLQLNLRSISFNATRIAAMNAGTDFQKAQSLCEETRPLCERHQIGRWTCQGSDFLLAVCVGITRGLSA